MNQNSFRATRSWSMMHYRKLLLMPLWHYVDTQIQRSLTSQRCMIRQPIESFYQQQQQHRKSNPRSFLSSFFFSRWHYGNTRIPSVRHVSLLLIRQHLAHSGPAVNKRRGGREKDEKWKRQWVPSVVQKETWGPVEHIAYLMMLNDPDSPLPCCWCHCTFRVCVRDHASIVRYRVHSDACSMYRMRTALPSSPSFFLSKASTHTCFGTMSLCVFMCLSESISFRACIRCLCGVCVASLFSYLSFLALLTLCLFDRLFLVLAVLFSIHIICWWIFAPPSLLVLYSWLIACCSVFRLCV